MFFNIAASNADRVRANITVTRTESRRGYTAEYRIIHGALEYNLLYLDHLKGLYIIETKNGHDKYFITFGEITPATIEVYHADIWRNGNENDRRTERAERYMKKYSQLACVVHGLVTSGALDSAEELEEDHMNGLVMEQYKPEPNLIMWRLRTAAGEVITRHHATKEECKLAALDKCKEYLSHPERYPKARGNAANVARLVVDALEAAETEESATAAETTTAAETEPQEATQTARDETPDGTTENTAGAQEKNAADAETAGKAAEGPEAVTHMTPSHACQNAPGRTETPQAVQTTTPPHKRPHRGKTRAGPPAAGSQATPPEVRFSGSMTKTVPKTGPPNRKPFCSTIFRFFDPVLAGPEKRSDPRGYQNLLQ